MLVRLPVAAWRKKPGVRFCLLFAACLGLMAVLFDAFRPFLVGMFVYPVSHGAAVVLDRLGVPAHLGDLDLAGGVCELVVAHVIYRVTFECTGIFALSICLASVLAFPASARLKLRGVFLIAPAFFAYSTARLVVMGLVARFAPSQIELFHVYVMVLVNIGFALLLWVYWLRSVVFREMEGT